MSLRDHSYIINLRKKLLEYGSTHINFVWKNTVEEVGQGIGREHLQMLFWNVVEIISRVNNYQTR